MKRNFINVQQNTEDWFKLRLGRITASNASTLFMGKKTTGYKGLVDRIAFERVHGEEVESKFNGNASTERGHDLEPIASKRYENITMRKCTNGGFHTFGDNLGASVDRNLEDFNGEKINGAVEIKCFEHKHHEKIVIDNDSFLEELKHQVQFQLYVTGYEFIDQFGYHPLYKDAKITVTPDFEYRKELEREIALFEEAVEIEMIIKQSIKRD